MKPLLLIISFCFFYLSFLFSQTPVIQWQKSYGGTAFDSGVGIKQTPDGGYVVVGGTTSNNGHVSGLHGTEYDIWVFKTNAAGNVLWQNTLGGINGDYGYEIYLTPDGGYLVAGTSSSNDGDVTGHHGVSTSPDIWLAKLNNAGILIWQKSLGGNGGEAIGEVIFTLDGGYIFAGKTKSVNTGDVIGGHSIFSDDIWIVKTDSIGNILWQKIYGGLEDEYAYAMQVTDDGGYLVAGYANSTDFDVTGNHGEDDVWILKLNSIGDLIWQKSLGGLNDDQALAMCKTNDGHFIIAGSSESNDGDVSGHFGSNSTTDFWIVKIDSLANIVWQKSFGGTANETPTDIVKTMEDNYLITGGSYSADGDISSHNGSTSYADFWTIKIDGDGNLLWENSNGGTDFDYATSIITTADNGFIICGHTNSDDIDVTFNHGINDVWLVKFLPECTPTPELCNSLDDNCNGLIDDGITETISISAGGPITFCQGGNVLLTATYSGATVQWKKNGTNIPGATSPTYLVNIKGTYTCVTTSPCGTALSSPIMVNVIKNPPAAITAGGATTFCAGGSVILTANAGGGLSYQWYKGASLIAGATSINYTATLAGNYKCRVTKTATGCFKNSNVISVSVPCKEGLPAYEAGELIGGQFTIYPNSASETIIIKVSNQLSPFSTLQITDVSGKIILELNISSTETVIDISNYPSGIYFVKLTIDGRQLTEKFIKQ